MIKLLLIGIWVCALTLGGVYAAVTLSAPGAETAEEDAVKLEYVAGEPVTLPVVSDGEIAGYFLGKVSVIADQAKAAELHIPLAPLITDGVFARLVGDQLIDVERAGRIDVEGIRTVLKDDLNKRLGSEVVTDVVFERLDYLTKEDLQSPDESRRRRVQEMIAAEHPPEGVGIAAEAPAH